MPLSINPEHPLLEPEVPGLVDQQFQDSLNSSNLHWIKSPGLSRWTWRQTPSSSTLVLAVKTTPRGAPICSPAGRTGNNSVPTGNLGSWKDEKWTEGERTGELTSRQRDAFTVFVFFVTHGDARGADPPEAEVGRLAGFVTVLQVWAQQGPVVSHHSHHGQHSSHQDEEEGHTYFQGSGL